MHAARQALLLNQAFASAFCWRAACMISWGTGKMCQPWPPDCLCVALWPFGVPTLFVEMLVLQ